MKKITKNHIKWYLLVALVVFVSVVLVNLWIETGIFQKSKIDSRDLDSWEYEDSFIKDSLNFTLLGNTETCWILIHSYAATPNEMKELAEAINSNLNDTVIVPLLEGHSQVPSKLIGRNLDYWYIQIESEFNSSKNNCEKINVLGSSFSSPIALRLAENNELNNVFVVNSFIYLPYHPLRILPLRTYIQLLTPIVHYNKKIQLAQINDQEGLSRHIAYWNMPYQPIKESFNFIDETVDNLEKIDEPIFIAHSEFDPTAGKKGAVVIYSNVNSSMKKINWYNNSSHVLLMDKDRNTLIHDILSFAQENA